MSNVEDELRRTLAEQRLDEAMPELSRLDRSVVGQRAFRIEIPIHDRYAIREAMDILKGMATKIDAMTRSNAYPTERSLLFDVLWEGQTAAGKINALAPWRREYLRKKSLDRKSG